MRGIGRTTFLIVCILALAVPGVAHGGYFREMSLSKPDGAYAYSNNWIWGIAADGTAPGRVYVATAYLSDPPGGVFRSTDWGAHWTHMGMSGLSAVGGTPLELRSSVVYGGWAGIDRSTNQAATWTNVKMFANQRLADICVNPTNPNQILALGDNDATWGCSLNYTLNGGSSWVTRVVQAGAITPGNGRAVDVTLSGRVIVAADNKGGSPGDGGGIYWSDNLGVTWTRNALVDLDATDVAVDRANPGRVYAVCSGIAYRSDTNGTSWGALPLPSGASFRTIDVDSLGRVFAGSYEPFGGTSKGTVYYSTNAGVSWTAIGGAHVLDQGASVATLDPAGCNLYVGNYKGLTRYWVSSAEELAGADRFATAIAVSKASQPVADGAKVVVIASAMNFPDAVVAAPLAVSKGGPVLLSGPAGLSAATLAEIDRVLAPGEPVYIIGGPRAVPEAARTALQARGYTVIRLGGSDRYATSALVAAEITPVSAYMVAYGGNFPDALSASAPAGDLNMPVLLTPTAGLAPSVRAYLASKGPFANGYIVGGTGVVSAAVESALDPYTSGDVGRLQGADRYATSLAIAKKYYPVPTAAGFATGSNYPDALTGSVLCGMRGGPLLLTLPGGLPPGMSTYLVPAKPGKTMVFGGRAVVSRDVRYAIEALW